MKEKLRTLFQQKFNPKDYRKTVLENLLHAQQLLNEPQFLEETNDGDRIYGLGYLTDADGKQIGLYYTDVVSGDVRRKRVGFRQMMKSYVKYGADAAIAVFADKEHWRLSYMSDLKGGETSAKRFSYILGDPNGQYNTPVNRLAQLGTQAPRLRLKDIFEAFSVETLSDEFFDLYRDHYADIVEYLTGKRMVKVDSKWVEKVIHAPLQSVYEQLMDVADADKIVRDYVKKMMGRIIFLHFLQKKGWLNGDVNFMRHTFGGNESCQDDFLEKILEPLFFGFLNTRKEDRAKLFDKHPNWDKNLLSVWENIPYLNGGLFEQDEFDNLNIRLPRSMFDDLFTFLASYNFTVDENDPDDAEVGVDPEMLGKIFESLLEDNKAKGAFYTPKEIVRYMCKESLIAYLDSKVNSEIVNSESNASLITNNESLVNAVRRFVEHHEMQPELEPYRDILDAALRNVKICDPAIGSGAFPMGLLNELWRCREALEPSVVSQVTDHRSQLKKQIIENNIYGVDIEKGAIDIARLRFWLSIVVDAEEPEPLPNFDYKFMQGNSLIESFEGHDLSHILDTRSLTGRGTRRSGWTENQTGMDFSSDDIRQNLRIWLKKYFSLTDHKEKAHYRELINGSVKSYIKQQGIGPTAEDKLDKLDPSANQDFFLWHTWFKDIFDNGGFDIVIGNPPYKIVERGDGNKLFYDEHYVVAHGGKRNLYHLFFERGINIAQHNSVLSYITPDTYFSGNDTSFLRKYLIENTAIKSIIHYTEKDKIFENVTQAVAVIVLTKHQPGQDFTIFSHGNSVTIKYRTLDKSNGWIFKASNSVIEKMKLCITTFDKVCIGYKGDVNLGLKKSFFRTTPMINSLPLVRGVQINKFSYVKGNEYCLKQALSKDQTSRQRIVFQEVANMGLKHRVKGTILSDVICGDSCNIIFPKDDSIDIMYMLGILNSKAVNYFFKYFNQTNHVPIGELKRIPFPVINKDEQRPIIDLTKRILALKDEDQNADTSSLENEIDKLVYQLYNLTPEEIAIIEQ